MVNEILEMDKTEKDEECARLKEKLHDSEKNAEKLESEVKNVNLSLKDKGEDYRLL